MITHDGKRYRGISYRNGVFTFRYTDGQGREHRIRVQTLHEALKLYHEKRDMKRKGGIGTAPCFRSLIELQSARAS